MAAYDYDPAGEVSVDLALVSRSFVTLFRSGDPLDAVLSWLDGHGYDVVVLDSARWSAEADLHRDIAAALGFPDYYGRNLDALNDCLRDVVDGSYGLDLDRTGLVVALKGFDSFADGCPHAAEVMLELLAEHARSAILIGRRIIGLAETDTQLGGYPFCDGALAFRMTQPADPGRGPTLP